MTLRIMLLGLVASLGYDLPSGQDVSNWTRSGREWACSRMAALSAFPVEADRAFDGAADCQQADEPIGAPVVAKATDDRAFEAATEAMAADFAADLLASRARESEPARDYQATANVGLPQGEELAAVVSPRVEDDPVVEPTRGMVDADEAPSRLDRVATAIRLTREAAEAWAAVIDEHSDEDGLCR